MLNNKKHIGKTNVELLKWGRLSVKVKDILVLVEGVSSIRTLSEQKVHVIQWIEKSIQYCQVASHTKSTRTKSAQVMRNCHVWILS